MLTFYFLKLWSCFFRLTINGGLQSILIQNVYCLFDLIFNFRACCTAPKADADTSETPVAVVVPCYLPNEQGIIVSTIDHILTRLAHEGPLTLYIVYNTPPGFWR